ncbi:AAA family ATPase [Streptomyces sp. NPDC002889]|uniref:AAA family ATPase n=1 Tax=Streptomyces sp. NPDC002889 TaxID=3364669 RepID=UPI0036BEDEDD
MPIRDTAVIAIEGTQASGKTTLIHALTSHFREQSINVACTGEPARVSPFLEEIVMHGKGTFDLIAEVDLFGQQLSVPLRAARHHQLLIADKTPANVVALSRLVLDETDPKVAPVLAALEAVCRAWMPQTYDAIVYCRDRFDQKAGGDRMRQKLLGLQERADSVIYQTCKDTKVPILDLPSGLTTAARVQWIDKELSRVGLIATA